MAAREENPWIVVGGGKHSSFSTPIRPKVGLPSRLVTSPPLQKGAVTQLCDVARQIALEILVCPINGENKVVKALIDTGAQINVVKRGLFPENVMKPAKKPLMLTLADGQAFWGGDREVTARLTFGKIVNHAVRPWRARANFYEGEIKADMILSLPWLAENGLDVLTKEGCLGERVGTSTYPITHCPDFEKNGD